MSDVKKWPFGIRLYVAVLSLLVTVEAYWWTQSVYGGSSLALIRLQEIYAWIALGLLLLTLSIGPVCKLWERIPGKALLKDSRRLLGVSAAWFATLHVGIAYIDQFKSANPLNLPGEYQLAFGIGGVALLILLAMAFTSFNAAFRKLGIWWFRLHRLIYLAVLLILFHAFNIGVHAATWPFLITLAVIIGLLFGLNFYLSFGPRGNPVTTLQSLVLCYGLVVTVGIFAYGLTQRLATEQSPVSLNGGIYENR